MDPAPEKDVMVYKIDIIIKAAHGNSVKKIRV